ncbi:MAG: hypothetical protein JEZ14_04980 [Marinilabiliaceae bacterium]|nr:hypothetical protein [Marinilabiliaceae bacterium]
MKKGLIFLLPLLLSLAACEKDNEETCDETPLSQCPTADISTCCPDEGECYYVYNGERYDSDDEIVKLCSPSGSNEQFMSLKLEIDNYTQKLIEEAKMAAVCQ